MYLVSKYCVKSLSRLVVSTTLLCFALAFTSENKAANNSFLNDRVKAAFILNIARYVKWPENKLKNNVKLCFFKQNPLGSAVNTIHNKRIKSRPLEIITIHALETENDCNILYLSQQQMADIESQAEHNVESGVLFSKDVLVIGDLSDDITRQNKADGVMVFFTRQKTRLGLEISKKILTRSELKLSSELLKLSRIK